MTVLPPLDLPASFGPTVAAVVGLVLVLQEQRLAERAGASPRAARGIAGIGEAIRHAEEVRKKGARLFQEIQSVEKVRADALSSVFAEPLPSPASDPVVLVEEMGAVVSKIDAGFQRVATASRMFAKAVKDSATSAPVLDRAYPGFASAIVEAEKQALQLDRDIVSARQQLAAGSIYPQLRDLLARTLAEEGFDDWVAGLPPGAAPLYDPADVEPIHWDPDRGWVEGAA
jgi:hypothetical protein